MTHRAPLILAVFLCAQAAAAEPPAPAKNVAAIVTVYYHNAHADLIVGRLLQTDTLDGKGKQSPLKLVSLYTDQRPANDLSRGLAATYGFRLSDTIEDALTLGTGRLAVDGVLLPTNSPRTQQLLSYLRHHPRFHARYADEIASVFELRGP